MAKDTGPRDKDMTQELERIEAFSEELQDLVITQARRMINLNLYTKALLSTLPVALLATDEEGRIRTVNDSAEEILGFREKDMQGRLLTDLFESNSEVADKVTQTFQRGRPFHMGSESLRLGSGKELVGNLYFQPLRDEEEEICGILLTVEDLTYVHFLRDAFKRYVPPSVSEMIAQDPQSLELGGEMKVLSVVFSDLIGFSAYAEQYPPNEMVTILSDYFSEMTDQVFAFQGTLKEYVGDELMAIFGAPVEQPDHAERACRAALAMQERLKSLREEWAEMGRPPLKARVGINSGPMLVGNLGSPHRFSYGVLGDQVNLASRLEGLSGVYGTEILIGENTARAVGGAFQLREVDWVQVKGREQAVRIYELVARSGEPLPGKRRRCLQSYASGLNLYQEQRFKAALEHFEAALAAWPDEGPSRVMAQRCRTYQETPPEEDWNGVFQHKRKK